MSIVDEHCTVKGTILKYNNKTYSCVLNQTDITTNKNKFYIMQIIKVNDTYYHFTRYGRTGEVGTTSIKPYTNEITAVNMFEKQFKTKTGNPFDTNNFVKKIGKYFMSQVSYEAEIEKVKDIIPKDELVVKSLLDDRVQSLLALLSNVDIMQQNLLTLNIDLKKCPLGKLNTSQLDSAGQIIDKIQLIVSMPVLTAEHKQSIVGLSNDFYTYLPMSFGRKKPLAITTQEMINNYKDTIVELKNMVVAVQVAANNNVGFVHPLDSIYANIKTKISPLDKDSEMYAVINEYVKNTHGPTHHYKLELMDVFEVEQENKVDKFTKYSSKIGNDTLLFHGSAICNWLSILLKDLMVNPQSVNKNVVITGRMFGDGLYTANCCTKSFSYCRTETSNNIGCLGLLRVPLGSIAKRKNADYYVTPDSLKREKCDSIQGIGRYTPGSFKTINNIKIPCGKLIESNQPNSLLYDEHIVYNSDQQLIKYLILVKNVK
jgi:poly [ADP-ribose] polymerase